LDDSLQICWSHTTNDHKLHGLHTYHVHALERTCASARVINCSLIYERFLFKLAVSILHITTRSKGHVLSMFTHRAHTCKRARAWLKHSLIFGRIIFKFAGHIPHMTTSYMGYILILVTHRGHASECACASARVINCSLIYSRFPFKLSVNILHITPSSKGNVLIMSKHRVHTCERACERVRD
jgi:hypothetical protein